MALSESEELELLELEAEAAAASPKPSMGRGEAALHTGAEGATFGFSDELKGAAAHPVGAAKQLANLLGTNFQGEDVEGYKKVRDDERASVEKAYEEYPVQSYASSIGASMLPTLLTGGAGAFAKGGQALSKLAPKLSPGAIKTIQTGLSSGVMGGSLATGKSKANSAGELTGDAAQGFGIGAVTGAGLQGLMNKLAPSSLNASANKSAVDAIGMKAGQKAKEIGRDNIDDLGQALRDSGIVKGVPSSATMLDRARTVQENAQQGISDILNKFDDIISKNPDLKGAGVNAAAVADDITKSVINPIKKSEVKAPIVAELEKMVRDIRSMGDVIPFQQAQRIKGYFKDIFSQGSPEEITAATRFGTALDKAAQNISNQIKNPTLAAEYAAQKKMYGAATKALDSLPSKVNKDATSGFSFTDMLKGGGAAVATAAHTGGAGMLPLAVGGAAVVGSKMAGKYGAVASTAAKSTASNVIKKVGDFLTASNDNIIRSAQTLAQRPDAVSQKLSNILMNASEMGANNTAKNALIFTLMQTPPYRALLQTLVDGEDSAE